MELNNNVSSSSSSQNSNSSDSEEQDIPYRPELKDVLSQTLSLLCPSEKKYHPRTVYFINDPKLNENSQREN